MRTFSMKLRALSTVCAALTCSALGPACADTSELTSSDSSDLSSSVKVSAPLKLSATTTTAGQTVTGKVTYKNTSAAGVVVQSIVIAARPPGGSHAGGPFDDFGPTQAEAMIAPGATVTLSASRTFSASDPTGAWDIYPTFEDGAGVWHDGHDLTLEVSGTSAPDASAPDAAAPPVEDGALAITSALAFSETNVAAGDTVTGTVTFTNNGTTSVDVQNVVIAARPPGGTHSRGPFDDFAPGAPAQTLAPGASLMLEATRTFSSADPSGTWDVYPTWQDSAGTWHDGTDGSLTVGESGGSGTGGSGSGTGDSGSGSNGPATGHFSVANGQILDPNGKPFIAKGIDADASYSASDVTPLFPGINFIRMPITVSSYPSVGALQANVTSYTDLGIVVEIEDHPWPEVAPYTGSALTAETDWYASLASAFATNPYVWFGTMNEPQTAYGAAESAISDQESAIYNAIRGTGNDTIIMMELMGGGNPGTIGAGFGMTPSTYASMTGIVWDLHFYAWSSNYSTDQATVTAALFGSASSGTGIYAAQTITSADGLVPVLIGEYGDSTDGVSVDPDWTQVLTAVDTSGFGSAAWAYSPGGQADILVSNGQLTAFGQIIAQYISGE